jgi:hypothetical protein
MAEAEEEMHAWLSMALRHKILTGIPIKYLFGNYRLYLDQPEVAEDVAFAAT